MSTGTRSGLWCSFAVLLGSSVARAQAVQTVLDEGDSFLTFTIAGIRDAAVGDGGEWFAAVTTIPPLGAPLSVVHGAGADGVFTPGPVDNLPGAVATLVNDPLGLSDYFWSGTTITIKNPARVPLVGERVRLDFRTAQPGQQPPADGIFSVQSADPLGALFTITHGTSASCGGGFAPCGQVAFERTIQSVDLDYSLACLPAYQGVMQLADDDDPATAPLVLPTANDSGVFWNSTLLLREDDVSQAPQVGAGTRYTRIWRSVVNAEQDYLVLARMNDPLVAGQEDALVFLDVSGSCPPTVQSERVLVRTGDPIGNTGNLRFRSFQSFEERTFQLNERGDHLFVAALSTASGLSSPEAVVVANGAAVLAEGQQVGGVSGEIVDLGVVALDLNDLGDFAIQVKVQTSPHGVPCQPQPPAGWCGLPQCPIVYCFPHAGAIVTGHVDGGPLVEFIEAGDPMPDASLAPGETLLRVGTRLPPLNPLTSAREAFPVLLTNGGDVIWYGEWGHLDAAGNEVTVGKGLFFNRKVIARAGQVLAANDALLEFGASATDVRAALEVSANGRYLAFLGLHGTAAAPRLALFRVDLGESVPYGTVVQASVGTGCTFPYPRPTLDCRPGLPLPDGTSGDFTLIGHRLQGVATGGPAGTVTAWFAFTPDAPANFPCGSFTGGFPFENLLGPSSPALVPLPYLGGAALFSMRVPAATLALVGTDVFVQAAFADSSGTWIGVTNALRYVIGAR